MQANARSGKFFIESNAFGSTTPRRNRCQSGRCLANKGTNMALKKMNTDIEKAIKGLEEVASMEGRIILKAMKYYADFIKHDVIAPHVELISKMTGNKTAKATHEKTKATKKDTFLKEAKKAATTIKQKTAKTKTAAPKKSKPKAKAPKK